MSSRFTLPILAALLALVLPGAALAAGPVCNAVWRDPARGRDIPVRIRMPKGDGRAPLILFSHGLGGSLDAGTFWAEAWADAGFMVIHLQHPGSDRSIFAAGDDGRGGRRRPLRAGGGAMGNALRAAITPEQLAARVADVKFVLDTLPGRRREGRCDLGRADLAHVGMSGHSFGAHTTQALAGQRFPATTTATAEPRISASIAFSPSPPNGGPDAQMMADVHRPFFSVTGTEDVARLASSISAADRERPFRAMPPGDKYLLVLAGGTHANFSGSTEGFGRQGPSDHLRRAVIETTTAFWRWTLLGDRLAKRALDEPGAFRNVLKGGDRFERR